MNMVFIVFAIMMFISFLIASRLTYTFFKLAEIMKSKKNLAKFLGYFSSAGAIVALSVLATNIMSIFASTVDRYVTYLVYSSIGTLINISVFVCSLILFYIVEIKNGNGKSIK